MLCVVAGEGSLPVEVIKKLQEDKKDFKFIKFLGYNYNSRNSSSAFINLKDILELDLLDFNAFFKFLEEEKVTEIVFCGRVKFPGFWSIISNFYSLKKHFPTLTLEFVKKVLKGDDILLKTVLNLIESKGLKVIPVQEILPNLLLQKDDELIFEEDKEKLDNIKEKAKIGLNLLDKISEFDIGQGCVIELESGRIIMEDIAGTDELIARASKYFTGEKVFIKTAKINQDTRIDMPTIGLRTIELLAKNNFIAIATKEKNLLMLDKNLTKEILKKNNINLVIF